MDKLELVDFDRVFYEKSREWLNDEEINRMTDTGDLPEESVRVQWFGSLSSRKDYLIWGVKMGNVPIGACGLKNIEGTKAEYWGYIGEKAYWGRGLGNQMMVLLEKKAADLHLEELCLKVLNDNERAKMLYCRRGFVIDNRDNCYWYMHKVL